MDNRPRKLCIRPLQLHQSLPEAFEDRIWSRLSDAVLAIFDARPINRSLEELYGLVEDVCLHNLAGKIYPKLQQLVDQYAHAVVMQMAAWISLEPAVLLDRVSRKWQDFCSHLALVRQIFLYLDRTYVHNLSTNKSLYEMGLQLFRARLSTCPEFELKLVDALLALIDADRAGEAVDSELIRNCLQMIISLTVYVQLFEKPFLERAETFFVSEGERLIQELSISAYLEHCEKRLTQEYSRADNYLQLSTRHPLIVTVESGLLEKHVGILIGPDFEKLLSEDQIIDLTRLYKLCSRIGALQPLCNSFKNHIRKCGTSFMSDEGREQELVINVLHLKSRMNKILEEAFQNNSSFSNSLKDSFEQFLNQKANKAAEMLAKYMDTALKSGNKATGLNDVHQDTESAIDAAMMIFRYIQGKDVFEAFYKKDLAKRLLFGRSASIDAEKAAISKIKVECGAQFTSKLEGMFTDVELSRETMLSFRQSPKASKELSQTCPGVDLNVQVLTSGFWPSYPMLDCALPGSLDAGQAIFRDYYLQQHSGRKLTWINSLGTCIIKATFDCGVKEVAVSLFQASVLLLFNDADSLSFMDIVSATGLEKKELRRTLQTLACAKDRILIKEPKGRDVEDGDVFKFNAAFTSRLHRIRINTIQLKETEDEQKKINETVLQDRQYQIDAAIVRIMKTRKTLAHKLLLNELVSQLRFPVAATDLKKRIESLIEREYIERDREDAQIYIYLA